MALTPSVFQLLLEEKLNTATLTEEVGAFVELLWAEATGRLSEVLAVSAEELSLNDVSASPGPPRSRHRPPDPGSLCR